MRTDNELLKGIAEQSTEAFEEFFARHRERVHRHLMGKLHHPDLADDVLQEVFLRVWTCAEQWDGRGACVGWLMRIATNLSLNQLRSLRRRREMPLDGLTGAEEDDDSDQTPSWLADFNSDPSLLCEHAEGERSLRRLIETLPEDKREVFQLVHDAQMDLRETAECLGIPVGTVKSRLYYARKHLAREWNELGIDEEDER